LLSEVYGSSYDFIIPADPSQQNPKRRAPLRRCPCPARWGGLLPPLRAMSHTSEQAQVGIIVFKLLQIFETGPEGAGRN